MKENQYDKIAKSYSKVNTPMKEYALLYTFKQIVGNIRGQNVLDLACGAGYYTRALAKMNPQKLIGFDISREMLEKAKQQEHSNIEYMQGDARNLNLNQQFDLITAIYLLNYAKTRGELTIICENIYNHLKESGKLILMTIHPKVIPRKDIVYEERPISLSGKDTFEDGEEIRWEFYPKEGVPFSFNCYYWTKETYNNCLKEAGFSRIEWIEPMVSEEGIKTMGQEYWKQLEEVPKSIVIVCRK